MSDFVPKLFSVSIPRALQDYNKLKAISKVSWDKLEFFIMITIHFARHNYCVFWAIFNHIRKFRRLHAAELAQTRGSHCIPKCFPVYFFTSGYILRGSGILFSILKKIRLIFLCIFVRLRISTEKLWYQKQQVWGNLLPGSEWRCWPTREAGSISRNRTLF